MSVISSSSHRERLAQRLTKRDGDGCFYCGVPFGLREGNSFLRTIDHYLPRCLGGTNRQDNLVLACFYCNHAKGDAHPEAFLSSAALAKRRKDVKRWIRIDMGLHPHREGFWHPRASIYSVAKGSLGCRTCGAVGTPQEHLDLFPCVAYRLQSSPRTGLGF